jgi:hypothetical protein
MSVFISYDFEDGAAHQILCLALEGLKIPYWDPKAMEPGSSLRDQLKKAIANCDVCIFLATPRSIGSDWCAAEIGAFWGVGKRVIVFKADPSVDPEKVPPQLRDDLWTSDIREVLRVVQQDITAATLRRRQDAARRPRLVSEMSIAMLHDLLTSLKGNGLERRPLQETMRLISEHSENDAPDAEAVLEPLVKQLLGVPRDIALATVSRHWPIPFLLRTTTGDWLGFAKAPIQHPVIEGYTKCVLLLCTTKSCVAAAVIGSVVRQEGQLECDALVAIAGDTGLGESRDLKPIAEP